MGQVIEAIESFRRFSGEPNRREDLKAFGLVRPGSHMDVRTAIISVAGQQREIRVTPVSSDDETILRPTKVDFRKAVRGFGDTSLRPLENLRVMSCAQNATQQT